MTNESRATNAYTALGDPMRRRIVEQLAIQPMPVGKLAEGLPVTRSAVSQHLRVLKDAGLVAETAHGTQRIYRLDPRGIGAMRDWLDAHWVTALDQFKQFVENQPKDESR